MTNTEPVPDILIVDDDEPFRFMAERRLRRSSHVLKSCETGQAAFDFLSENRVDLIILDLRLPEMSGEVLLEKLIEEDLLNGAKVCICTSALPDAGTCSRIERLGAAVLTKEVVLSRHGIETLFSGRIDAA